MPLQHCVYEVQLCPAQVPPLQSSGIHTQLPVDAAQAPSFEPVAVPVRQLPLHQPQLLAAVHVPHAVLAAQGSATPPPVALPPPAAPPPSGPVLHTPPRHESPAQQSLDAVQATWSAPHEARQRVAGAPGEPRQKG